MKKLYTRPEWQVVDLSEEDVITTSGVKGFDNDGLFERGEDKVDSWVW